MKEHFCPAEKSIITYQGECSWCGEQEALAQPEQEPVALPCCGYTDASAVKWNSHNQVVQCHNCGQVYTTPPQRTWVGLTDEEENEYNYLGPDMYWVIQEIAAKLKELNT